MSDKMFGSVQLVVSRGVVSRFNQKDGSSRQWVSVNTEDGELKLTTTKLDFQSLPLLVPVRLTLGIVPAVWGQSLVLEVVSMTAEKI